MPANGKNEKRLLRVTDTAAVNVDGFNLGIVKRRKRIVRQNRIRFADGDRFPILSFNEYGDVAAQE